MGCLVPRSRLIRGAEGKYVRFPGKRMFVLLGEIQGGHAGA